MTGRSLPAAASLLAGLLLTSAAAAAEPTVKPLAGPIAVTGSFGFAADVDKPKKRNEQVAKLRKSVSGIACKPSGRCLIAFDEGTEARFATLDGTSYTAEPKPVTLAPRGLFEGPEAGEIDAEAVAFDGHSFYVTGSYARKRKDCALNVSSRQVVRLGPRGGAFTLGDLGPALDVTPLLDAARGACLDGRGLDIEALAVKDGRLWFGLRGPAANGVAHVLSVDVAAPFQIPPAAGAPKLFDIAVGAGRGVRDMATVAGGFLILAGPDDAPAHADTSWRVLFWDGASATKPLATLDLSGVSPRKDVDGCDDEAAPKPEALLVTRDDPAAPYGLTVLSDGLCDGGPLRFEVPRQP